MLLQLADHIELHGDNPLDATIVGRKTKVYLVAEFYLGSDYDMDATMAQFDLDRAQVHAIMAFYYGNEAAIQSAIETAEAETQAITVNATDVLAELRQRLDKS
jgi:uncharacterized protein (DUF433 family)